VYYKKNGETQHKSYVVVSDEMSHSPSTVHAFIDKLIPELRLLSPELSFIHYWTDGPTSQNRNRQCFFTVANHRELYGVGARWNYFEVGHAGKGHAMASVVQQKEWQTKLYDVRRMSFKTPILF
jgi:hypothetical protein